MSAWNVSKGTTAAPESSSWQQEIPLNWDEPCCGLNQGCCRELPDAVHFNLDAVCISKPPDYEIEIAIARCQHCHVTLRCQFNHVECDTNVPISLCGSVASLNKRLEFNFEADGPKDLLEADLLRVLTIDRVGNRSNDLSSLSDVNPKPPIVEMATAALPDGVEDVLHIDEYRDLIHGFPVYVDRIATSICQLAWLEPGGEFSRRRIQSPFFEKRRCAASAD